MIIVSKDNKTQYTSIQDAIDSIPLNNNKIVEIYIKNGIYEEKLFIEKPFIKLIGENRDKTVIRYSDYANKQFSDGKKYGTFNSYTAFLGGDNSSFENITFENRSGAGKDVGQAIAVYADADKLSFKNCSFLSYQDTLFTAPLPPKPVIPGGFFGPRELTERRDTVQYYENCFIKGDIDFIFGSATAIFNKCEIFSISGQSEVSYITASSTPEYKEFGYIFIDCILSSDTNQPFTYLGRPWRDFAKVVFLNCYMGPHIMKEGWYDWNKKDAQNTVFFAEYNSRGPGALIKDRVHWAKILVKKEARVFFEFVERTKKFF